MSSSEHVVTLRSPAGSAKRGVVIVVPPFGKRIVDLTFVALVLQENGFDVVRFDARSHVGESSGEIENFTLGSLAQDLEAVRENLGEHTGALILAGISLSSPIAVRHAADTSGIDGLVSLAGVVDVRDTIGRIVGADLTARYLMGQPAPEHCEIFGHRVRGREFATDLVDNDYEGLDATIGDIARIATPIHLIAAQDDELVPIGHVKKVARSLPEGSSLTVIENSTHEFSRSMTAARQALKGLARGCLRITENRDAEPSMPRLTTLIDSHGSEQKLLRELHPKPQSSLA